MPDTLKQTKDTLAFSVFKIRGLFYFSMLNLGNCFYCPYCTAQHQAQIARSVRRHAARFSTSTLTRNRASLLAHDIQQARAFRLRTEDVTDRVPAAEAIAGQVPHLAELCTVEEIKAHIDESSR